MRIFLVPAEQVEWVENWNVIGLVATNSGGFRTNGLFVPDGYSVAQLHPLKARLSSPLYKFPMNSNYGIGFSAVALGTARAMLDACISLAKEKTPRAARHSLKDNHLIQFQVGEAEARLRSARNYIEFDGTSHLGRGLHVRRAGDDHAAARQSHGGNLCHP